MKNKNEYPTFMDAYNGEKKFVENYSNKFHIQAAILDLLLEYGETNVFLLEERVFSYYATIETQYNMPYINFQRYLRELWLLGIVSARIDGIDGDYAEMYQKSDNKQELRTKTFIKLSDIGITALKNQTFQLAAINALSSRRVHRLGIIAVVISLIGVAISLFC